MATIALYAGKKSDVLFTGGSKKERKRLPDRLLPGFRRKSWILWKIKPDCEKNLWEKFCDGLVSAAEWCKEHWKLIVTVVLVSASAGRDIKYSKWRLILGGVEEGRFSGAIGGAIFGGMACLYIRSN